MNARRMTQDDLEMVTRATVSGVMRVLPRLVAQIIDDRMQADAVKPLAALSERVNAVDAHSASVLHDVSEVRAAVEQVQATVASDAQRLERLSDTHAALFQRASDIDAHIDVRVRKEGEMQNAFTDRRLEEFSKEVVGGLTKATAELVDARAVELRSTLDAVIAGNAAQILRVDEIESTLSGVVMSAQLDELRTALGDMRESFETKADACMAGVASAIQRNESMRAQLVAVGQADEKRADETAASVRVELDELRTRLDSFAASAIEAVTRHASELIVSHADALSADMQARIAAIPAGPPGEPGTAGKDGEPGRDGYDATFTQPVPYVTGRMFARGAVVQHLGALWFANTDTDREPGAPMSGFTLIVDGVHPDAIEADERGYLHMRLQYASGHVERLPLNFRPMQYRGIWDEAREYLPNDCLTCNGGLFLAKRENTGQRPDTDAGAAYWQLVVKRGKDGRNGNDGKPGADGRSFAFRGKFNAKADYRPDDVVLSGDTLMICVKVAPARDRSRAYAPQTSDDWQVLMPAVIVDKR